MDDFQTDQSQMNQNQAPQSDVQDEILNQEEGLIFGEEGRQSEIKNEFPEAQTPSQRDDYIKKVAEQEPPFVVQKTDEIGMTKEDSRVEGSDFSVSEQAEQGESVALEDHQFTEKIEIGEESQRVLEKAVQSDKPEEVLDQEEFAEDKKLAEKLIKEAGLSPEMVEKALQEKKKMIEDQTEEAAVIDVSEITTDHAKGVLGDEYEEMQEEN